MTKFILLLLLTSLSCSAQNVADLMLKIPSMKSEELWFGFAAGDRIVFSFKEDNDKEISEIEVIEYPHNKRFSLRKVSHLAEQEISIPNSSVYLIRFKNNTMARRDCRIKIDRIPLSQATANFNTTVKWVSSTDTTWKFSTREGIVKYDTTYQNSLKKTVINEKLSEELILNKTQRLNAKVNLKPTKSYVSFTLPEDKSTDTKNKKLISWAYWVGVNEAGNKAWEQNSKIISKVVKGGASIFLSPLGALAAGVVADLAVPTMGEDVEYWLVNPDNKELFMTGKDFKYLDSGKGVAAFSKLQNTENRSFSLLLKNDNIVQSIDVNVKVVAIYQVQSLGIKPEMTITPIKGKIQERTPLIKTIQKPVLSTFK